MKLVPHGKAQWRRMAIRLGVFFAVLFAGVAAFLAYCVVMPGESFSATPRPLSVKDRQLAKRLEAHVVHLAQTIGARHTRRPKALLAAASYVDAELRKVGYATKAQTFTADGLKVSNIEAVKRGGALAEQIIVIGAHYDSVSVTPGADDNASGVAALIELARLLEGAALKRSVHFVGFPNEEPPFFRTHDMGSYHYAKAASQGWGVTAMICLESLGYFDDTPGSQKYPPPFSSLYPDRGNFVAFVGNLASRTLVRRVVGRFREKAEVPSDGIAAPQWVNGVDFSDHLNFWKFDLPALMVTDTAPFRNPHYHQPSDKPATLDYERLARVTVALAAVIKSLANEP